MKFFSRKNKINFDSQSGFAALFSVLVSSVLLIMALAISGVAYKEQLFSINAKASQYSFMAADSGMECALLWDVQNGLFVPANGYDPADIECGDSGTLAYSGILITSNRTLHVYKFPVFATVNNQTISSCAIFSINKDYDDDGDGIRDSTKIDSRGYNVDCGDIDYSPSQSGNGVVELQFLNGTGTRAVERFLGAIYSNS